jgi:hypothetical protein
MGRIGGGVVKLWREGEWGLREEWVRVKDIGGKFRVVVVGVGVVLHSGRGMGIKGPRGVTHLRNLNKERGRILGSRRLLSGA